MVYLGGTTPWTPHYFTWPKAILDELEKEKESAVYNTLPGMLEEEVPNVEVLPTVSAPAASSASAAVCFAQEALPTLPLNQAIHNVKYNVKYTIKYTVLTLGGATKRAFLLAYLHKLQEVLSAQTNQAWPTFLDQSKPKRPPSVLLYRFQDGLTKPLPQPKWANFLAQLGLTKPPTSAAPEKAMVLARR